MPSALKEGGEPKAAGEDGVQEATGIAVTFVRSGVSANWHPSFGSILEMAEGQGLDPDYSCRSGICGTCVCKLIEGEVEYFEEPLEEPDPGHILICCSRPKGDIVIEL